MPHDPGIIHPRYAGFAQELNASDLCLPPRLLSLPAVVGECFRSSPGEGGNP
jgi:hypothetical protein